MPIFPSESAKACRPECLPSTICAASWPTVLASMISYVSRSSSTPCWWMPASCANAFRPTTALLYCTG